MRSLPNLKKHAKHAHSVSGSDDRCQTACQQLVTAVRIARPAACQCCKNCWARTLELNRNGTAGRRPGPQQGLHQPAPLQPEPAGGGGHGGGICGLCHIQAPCGQQRLLQVQKPFLPCLCNVEATLPSLLRTLSSCTLTENVLLPLSTTRPSCL